MCCAVGNYFTPTLKKQSFDSVQGHWITFSYISSLEWSATPANVLLTVIITYLKYRLHLERFHRLVNLRFKYGIQEYLSSSSSQENDSRSQVLNSPPHIQRQNSLRTKLSLPNLRRKKSRNNANEDCVSVDDWKPDQSRAARRSWDATGQRHRIQACVAEFCAFPGCCCADEWGFWGTGTWRLHQPPSGGVFPPGEPHRVCFFVRTFLWHVASTTYDDDAWDMPPYERLWVLDGGTSNHKFK